MALPASQPRERPKDLTILIYIWRFPDCFLHLATCHVCSLTKNNNCKNGTEAQFRKINLNRIVISSQERMKPCRARCRFSLHREAVLDPTLRSRRTIFGDLPQAAFCWKIPDYLKPASERLRNGSRHAGTTATEGPRKEADRGRRNNVICELIVPLK